ncbi:hypothetical protein EVAR_36548_1 [Eumeta japonica]|uniref:Uncharacterized protein n=1 Tax=Eumeta variegata TaxID=151549 RepID=A0A4C1Z885_EUMVA|nr:hypothetical protein EVAR_36548_1 [Eumeta japonica]
MTLLDEILLKCGDYVRGKATSITDLTFWNEKISRLRKECFRMRLASQRDRKIPNPAEFIFEYRAARRILNAAIRDSKQKCWNELIKEVKRDACGRPYKIITSRLKKQSTPSVTCPRLLK